MKTRHFILALVVLLTSQTALSFNERDYIQRFMTYYHWNQQFPEVISKEFLQFVDSNTPLARKLREKWLYKLAQKKDWLMFQQVYRGSSDVNLQCFAQIAHVHNGQSAIALAKAKRLWLTGQTLPKSCNILFALQGNALLTKPLLNRRIALALDQQNLSLVRYLLKQYPKLKEKDNRLLLQITSNPKCIQLLVPGTLQSSFYLYGLKRLVSVDVNDAIRFWHHPMTKTMLSTEQQQLFLSYLAFYQAVRNSPDAETWFAQVLPAYRTNLLVDWQIRHALKQQHWSKVKTLIQSARNNQTPRWQYWLARSLEQTHQTKEANELLMKLARSRHYYGFLASTRLKQPLSLHPEPFATNRYNLAPYQLFTTMVKQLINDKQDNQAARLIIDFTSELPKEEKQLIIYWLIHELKWYSTALHLSSSKELADCLSLRFPLPYPRIINQFSTQFQIPKALIYAIIRQESGFREGVVSKAGAKGLMQVMPSTAMMVAKKNQFGHQSETHDRLFHAEQNIMLGTAYLYYLANYFHHHFALMTAAYNAGPRPVKTWSNMATEPLDVWIETIPWHETRNYLKNIMSFYVVYQYRLGSKPTINNFLKPLNTTLKIK